MKPDIHPKFVEAEITCACGNSFKTLSNRDKISVEICSGCHPFFTGKQKFIDITGRVDRFNKKVTVAGEVQQTRQTAKKKAVEKRKAAEEAKAQAEKEALARGGTKQEGLPAEKNTGTETV